MAEENKNQDPEEQKKSSGSDDDFGLPDFDFEALDDDDDDNIAEEAPAAPSAPTAKSEPDDVPSLDTDDLEGLDLDDLGDIDLSDMGDLGDLNLDDLDLDDLDLDDLDLGDLDTDLDDFKESESSSTYAPAKSVAASAERDEDIFDASKDPASPTKDDMSEAFEDDGSFFEEESFEGFDMGSGSSELSGASSDMFEMGSSGDLDSDIFGSGSADFDVEIPEDEAMADEPVPFAKRPVESAYHLDDDEAEDVSAADIERSRGKFTRIVILGILLFTSLGFGFLYWNGTFTGGHGESKVVKTENKKSKEVAANKSDEITDDKKAEPAQPTETKAEEKLATKEEPIKAEPKKEEPKKVEPKKVEPKKEEPKKAEPKKEEPKKAEPKKEEPKRETKPTTTQPKTTTTQPKATTTTPVRNTPGQVTVLSAKTGQRHIIVASFLDSQSAQDHASKLAANGASPVIIPPFDGAPNHRVAIASFSTLNEALDKLEGFRQQYGAGAWVLRY